MKENYAVIVEDLWFKYVASKDYVLRGVNFKVKPGEFVVIMGPSGCGKSTLAYTLNGIIPHVFKGEFKGRVIVNGLNTLEHTVSELATHVGMVFQNPEAQIVAMTVIEELSFGPENLGLPRDEIERRVREVVKVARLEGKEYRPTVSLSGGEKQALAIASVLALRPSILVLDEVTSMLDPIGTELVSEMVVKLNREYGLTIIAIDHRVEWAAEYADRIVVMDEGQILGEGKPEEVFSSPDLVRKIGFRAPQVSELAYELINRGLNVKKIPISLSEAVETYSKLIDMIMKGKWRPLKNEQ